MKISKIERTYCQIVCEVERLLRDEGFSRKDDSFHNVNDGITRGLEFQRSEHTSKNQLKFTLNIGIRSDRLRHILGQPQIAPVWDYHVFRRIGFLLPSREDRWWSVTPDTEIPILSAEIKGIICLGALPFLRRFKTDRDLRKYLGSLIQDREASHEDALHIALLDGSVGTRTEFASSLRAFQEIALEAGFTQEEVKARSVEITELVKDGK
jgi:hypothetical protein